MDTGPLSICMTSDDLLPAMTGAGTHVQQVARALAARGHRVSVLTSRRAGEPEEEEWHGVRLHRCWTVKVLGFYQALPTCATIGRLLDRERPDVVHHHYFSLLMDRAQREAGRRGLPQVVTYHFNEDWLAQPLAMRPLRGVMRRRIAAACNRCDAVVAVSRGMAAVMAERGVSQRVHQMPIPIPLESLPRPVPALRGPGFTVLYAGRLAPEKNLPLLLDAFARLAPVRPDARLWIAGDGPLRGEVARRAGTGALAGRVEMLGQLGSEELARRYLACDAFVLPSLRETFGLVAIEAMWFGRPVVVTGAIASARELVDPGVNGFIVDPHDPADLAARLLELADDPALRARLGAAGRSHAAAHREGPVLDRLEALYGEVVEARRGALCAAG